MGWIQGMQQACAMPTIAAAQYRNARCSMRWICAIQSCYNPLPQAVRHSRVEPLLMDALRFAALPPGEMNYTHALLKVRDGCDRRSGGWAKSEGRLGSM